MPERGGPVWDRAPSAGPPAAGSATEGLMMVAAGLLTGLCLSLQQARGRSQRRHRGLRLPAGSDAEDHGAEGRDLAEGPTPRVGGGRCCHPGLALSHRPPARVPAGPLSSPGVSSPCSAVPSSAGRALPWLCWGCCAEEPRAPHPVVPHATTPQAVPSTDTPDVATLLDPIAVLFGVTVPVVQRLIKTGEGIGEP